MSSAAYGEADRLLEDVTRRLSPHPMDGAEATAAAVVGAGRAILALVDEVEPLVELLRELVEQQRPVEVVAHFVDGPRLDGPRVDADVPFVQDPDPNLHDHCGRCAQCDAPGGTCCPHCSGARIGAAGLGTLAHRGAGGRSEP